MSDKRQKAISSLAESLMNIRILTKRSESSKALFYKYQFSNQQMPLLVLIYTEGKVLVKDVAETLGITSSAATQMINTLIKKGLLLRTIDAKDKRAVRISLSAKGKKIFSDFHKDMLKNMQNNFKLVSDSELDRVVSVFKKVLFYLKS